MSNALYRDCARLFMVGFPGPRIDDDFTSLMDAGLFGAILFKRNVEGARETASLCRETWTVTDSRLADMHSSHAPPPSGPPEP